MIRTQESRPREGGRGCPEVGASEVIRPREGGRGCPEMGASEGITLQ